MSNNFIENAVSAANKGYFREMKMKTEHFTGLSSFNKEHVQFLKQYAATQLLPEISEKIKESMEIIYRVSSFDIFQLKIDAHKFLDNALQLITCDALIEFLEKEQVFLSEEEFKIEYGISHPDGIL